MNTPTKLLECLVLLEEAKELVECNLPASAKAKMSEVIEKISSITLAEINLI
jgi:hypothetical protein